MKTLPLPPSKLSYKYVLAVITVQELSGAARRKLDKSISAKVRWASIDKAEGYVDRRWGTESPGHPTVRRGSQCFPRPQKWHFSSFSSRALWGFCLSGLRSVSNYLASPIFLFCASSSIPPLFTFIYLGFWDSVFSGDQPWTWSTASTSQVLGQQGFATIPSPAD